MVYAEFGQPAGNAWLETQRREASTRTSPEK
jgi:hypothetical protein